MGRANRCHIFELTKPTGNQSDTGDKVVGENIIMTCCHVDFGPHSDIKLLNKPFLDFYGSFHTKNSITATTL